jgi:hypothetical protein
MSKYFADCPLSAPLGRTCANTRAGKVRSHLCIHWHCKRQTLNDADRIARIDAANSAGDSNDAKKKSCPGGGLNAVEIEEAISVLAEQEFDSVEFPFAFLQAFENKETTIKRLRAGASNNKSDLGGVLQTNNIHIAVAMRETLGAQVTASDADPAEGKRRHHQAGGEDRARAD